METEFFLGSNGQEVQQDDINLISSEAAHATDWLLAELLRTSTPSAGPTPLKYVIPAGARRETNTPMLDNHPLITSSGSNNHKVRIFPFRAVVGSLDLTSADPQKALRNIRSVGHYGDVTNMYSELQLPLATNNRWDLIYAKVDIDVLAAAVNRFVKIGDGAATTASVQVNKNTQISFGSVQGTEAVGTPTRPLPPSDSATTFYIPIAYVKVPAGDLLTTIITNDKIFEAYPTIGISTALGGIDARPANRAYEESGFNANEGLWAARPVSFLPPGMVGKVERVIPLHCADSGHGTPAIPAGGITTLDNSVDWRRRIFKTHVNSIGPTGHFPWEVGATQANGSSWSGLATNVAFLRGAIHGHSFHPVYSVLSGFTGPTSAAIIAMWTDDASSSPQLPSGAKVAVYVDMADGVLKVWRNGVNATALLLLWIEATGSFYNAPQTGD